MVATSRLTSTAGRHRTLPSLMTYAPAGRAATPKTAALAFLAAVVVPAPHHPRRPPR
jgi:hypothetical protein